MTVGEGGRLDVTGGIWIAHGSTLDPPLDNLSSNGVVLAGGSLSSSSSASLINLDDSGTVSGWGNIASLHGDIIVTDSTFSESYEVFINLRSIHHNFSSLTTFSCF